MTSDYSTYTEDEYGNLIGPGLLYIPERERTKPEVYSRCVGYLRPVEQWNVGKQAEFRDRKSFSVPTDAPPDTTTRTGTLDASGQIVYSGA